MHYARMTEIRYLKEADKRPHSIKTNALNRSDNRDHITRAHIYLSYLILNENHGSQLLYLFIERESARE